MLKLQPRPAGRKRPALPRLMRELVEAHHVVLDLEFPAEAELAAVQQLARDPRCAGAVDTLNLRIDRAPWGVSCGVEMTDSYYAPSDDGEAALIVAAEAGGDLIDLVACRLRDRATATRLGAASILGEDYVEMARSTGRTLPLFADPLQWAHGGFVGAVVIDWQQARFDLDGVASIRCPRSIAAELHRATRECWPQPHIEVPRG